MKPNRVSDQNYKLSKAIISKVYQLNPTQKQELLNILSGWKIDTNQRGSERKVIKSPIDYTVNDKFYSDILENLSEEGAFINTTVKFKLGDQTTVLVSLPGLNKSVKSSGKIVRNNESGIGIQFFDKFPGMKQNNRLFY